MKPPLDLDDPNITTDGRKQRSEDSKRRIVAAMLELVREGRIAPTAEEVATRAEVGLRTVFRRFKDMESLYAEMAVAINDKIDGIATVPNRSIDWRANLKRLVERRLQVYEVIMPYRVAAEALKFTSTILLNRHMEIVRDERQRLLDLLPVELLDDRLLIEGLEAALSFDMWNQLRNDQRLSASEAGEVVRRIVESLIGFP
ncbi:MAG: TetR/AcrR family transcriptional regulator, partial [Proteobacteria bacterium]|nr:TetR/AcrR family transcriptional regulator [Pseudomonadota bacterium]